MTRADPTATDPARPPRLRRLLAGIAAFPGSRRFLWLVVAAYLVVGVMFAVVIRWGALALTRSGILAVGSQVVVPDEDRHLGLILYYADRGWWRGPVITDLDPRYLRMGEWERDPSYLYHWVMSGVVDLLRLITDDYDTTVITVRVVTVLIGAAGLIVAWRLLRALRISPLVSGLAVAGLSLTGRYVWQGAGVSYDIPSMVLFLLFLLFVVRVVNGGGLLDLAVAAMLAALTTITKYTFLPFVGAGLVAILIWYLMQKRREDDGAIRRDLLETWRAGRARVVAVALGLAVAVSLFAERIVGNLVTWGAVEPNCAVVHSDAACQAFAIYRRNQDYRAAYLQAVADGAPPAQYEPFAYTGEWLQRYYTSTFFYAGRTSTMQVGTPTVVLVVLMTILIVALVVLNRRAILTSAPVVFVAVICTAYVAGTYFFNVNTYLRYEQYFAHQGRYILPVLPVVYALIIWLMVGAARRLRGRTRLAVGIPLGLLVVSTAIAHLHVIAFALHVDSSGWFSPYGLAIIRAVLPFV